MNKARLTQREKQVLDLVTLGKLNKEIAFHLDITLSTTEKHLTSIYAKLKVRNRTEAALLYKTANSRNPQLLLHTLRKYPIDILSTSLGNLHSLTERLLSDISKGVHMNKRDLVTSIIAGAILALIALVPIANGTLFALGVSAQSEADAVRQQMLTSHTNWSTLEGEAKTTWYLSSGDQSVITSDFSIENPNKSRFQMSSEGITWISNGNDIYEIDDNDLSYVMLKQPDTERLITDLPSDVSSIQQNEIYRYPLAMWALSPVADYIYPTGLAQRTGDYTILGEDTLLNRKVWILGYQLTNDLGDITISAKYWVDQGTGIILRAQVYSTEKETFGKLSEETAFQWIKINPTIVSETFAPSLEGYKLLQPEQGN